MGRKVEVAFNVSVSWQIHLPVTLGRRHWAGLIYANLYGGMQACRRTAELIQKRGGQPIAMSTQGNA